jgi:hypothetical protein
MFLFGLRYAVRADDAEHLAPRHIATSVIADSLSPRGGLLLSTWVRSCACPTHAAEYLENLEMSAVYLVATRKMGKASYKYLSPSKFLSVGDSAISYDQKSLKHSQYWPSGTAVGLMSG